MKHLIVMFGLVLAACAGPQHPTIQGSGVKAPAPGGYEWMCHSQHDNREYDGVCGRGAKQ